MSQQFFETLVQKYPDYATLCKSLEDFKAKKLYFQLTSEAENFVNDPFLRNTGILFEFFDVFLKDIQKKINPIKLTQIVISICKNNTDYQTCIKLVTSISEDVKADLGARCLCYSTIGIYQLLAHNVPLARDEIDKVDKLLEHEEGLEAVVYSQYHLLCTRFYEAKNDANEFFISGVKYLKFVDQSSLDLDEKTKFVTSLVIAALVGNKVYNFGEFLNNPICEALTDNGRVSQLIELLRAINNGNMKMYLKVQEDLSQLFSTEPSLIQNKNQIIEKASIVSLMELIFRSMTENRTFSFTKIAEVTCVPLNSVEILVMRALSLGLVKGFISQVQQEATFYWVLPRILDKTQFQFVSNKLNDWMQMTRKTLGVIESAGVQL
ncbi:26S proteasome non-ATPase regulatory subunit, putative [Entamoeba invadens IP1]|uniref:26S proteasome non-ATPase regulatory subunit, putative n=1 Tax=Entamoeba invadens IP1 TaxID=370355 RepID=A0A0A1TYF3_ENTIV|nr:26S proteasome non-ATPase regulatory subunit, putative [Entamoeba invadens IP1]ELP83526.1 26S proteasome non-ATPase regulatory subunit, putative [Entamoeba invadens IP1]|eukprot:XP_004182872.1 26S proteasome non-ATPase regulatory subunit, putative [Entamoeba invadens IP1]